MLSKEKDKTMNIIKTIALAFTISAFAFAQQNTLIQTSLSAAVTATAGTIRVASATGIVAPTNAVAGSLLFVQDRGQYQGELMRVTAVSGTTITVNRTAGGNAVAHASGAAVFVASVPNWFTTVNPTGSCTTARTFVAPLLNTTIGQFWLCSSQTLTWVPSWGPLQGQAQLSTATATASVAGATAISGPLVEISGTEAITSFTMGLGWNGHPFCVQPTAAFTTVAGNNIAEASTADANQTLCFTWNARAAAFTSSY